MARMWRLLARILPLRLRRELPGWGYLEVFVQTFATMPGNQRVQYLSYAFNADLPYTKLLIRAGGVHAAFRLIMGRVPSREIAELFADPPGLLADKVTTADIANNLVMTLNFIECPPELSPLNSEKA